MTRSHTDTPHWWNKQRSPELAYSVSGLRWHFQLTFLISEFASIWTEVTEERNPVWEIAFEIWLHMFTGGAPSHFWALVHQIGVGFHIFLSSFCLPASPFISCSSTVPSTSTFPCLSSRRCQVAHVRTVCAGEHAAAEKARAGRRRVGVWFLGLSIAWAAYQTGCASGAEFISRQNLSVGWGVDGLASNFLTHRLSPGRLPLFLSSLIPPFLCISIQRTLAQSHWPQLARQTSRVFGGSTKRPEPNVEKPL